MKTMRAPTEAELDDIRQAVGDGQEHLDNAAIGVADHYITDCPGYSGRVVSIVWPAGPEVHEVFYYQKDGTLRPTWRDVT